MDWILAISTDLDTDEVSDAAKDSRDEVAASAEETAAASAPVSVNSPE